MWLWTGRATTPPSTLQAVNPFATLATSGGLSNPVTDANTGTNNPVRVLDTRPGSVSRVQVRPSAHSRC
jgi:hypothetical protein